MRLRSLERKFEDLFGIPMRDFCSVRRTDWRLLQKRSAMLVFTIGIIDRVHDAIRAHDLQGEQELGQGKHPTGRDIHLLQEVVRDRPLQMSGCLT